MRDTESRAGDRRANGTTPLRAGAVTYRGLVGNGNSYVVPPYQRNYSWTEEQWEDLWSEVLALREDPAATHYLGALIVETTGNDRFVVIDGQQRLATLNLLALAVIARLQQLADDGTEADTNRIWARRLRDRFIGEKHPAAISEASRLSLTETDDFFYLNYLVQLRSPSLPRALPRSNRLLHDCFHYFGDRLREIEDLRDSGEALVALMTETVAKQCLFVLIEVENDREAYAVFETMNARGVKLTTADLLKNSLFSKCPTPVDRELLDHRWRRLTATVTPERFAEFVRSHLLTERREVPRSHLFRLVNEQVHHPLEVFGLVARLEKRADFFAALFDPNHEEWRDWEEARRCIRDLRRFGMRQFTSLLFTVREKFSRPDFVRVLRLLLVVGFRHRVVSGLNPNDLEAVGAAAARAVGEGVAETPAAVHRLLESVYVDDLKIQQDFSVLRLTTRGRERKLARHILTRLEADASNRAVDPDSDPGTIEHILPENPGDEFWEEFPEERREAFVCRIGNLTLLERRANRDLANRPYSDKVAAYEKSDYGLTRQVAEMAPGAWTPEQLEKRQRRLAERAVQIWRSDFA